MKNLDDLASVKKRDPSASKFNDENRKKDWRRKKQNMRWNCIYQILEIIFKCKK